MTRTNLKNLFKTKVILVAIIINLKSLNICQIRQCVVTFMINNGQKRTYGNMPLSKKYFIYYCLICIKEGLNTDLKTSELMLCKYDKELYRSCRHHRSCVIEIKKAFKKHEFICNMCFKPLQNQDRINPQIHIIWTENQQYRVFASFHRSFVNRVLRYENIKDKFGEIPQEVIDNNLNACELGTLCNSST